MHTGGVDVLNETASPDDDVADTVNGDAASARSAIVGKSIVCVASAAFTVTDTSLVADSAPSFAASRSTYAPGCVNEAVVMALVASPNATLPGPLTLLHANVR